MTLNTLSRDGNVDTYFENFDKLPQYKLFL
jgi:hypothetical protein